MIASKNRVCYNKQKGQFAELHAAAFLCRNGCTILSRNYRYKNGELDIVAKNSQGVILFVEVKSVWDPLAGNPASRVNSKKQYQVWKTAAHFLHFHGGQNQKCRFDVISVDMRFGKLVLKHYPDAFVATRVIPEC
ncbi:MAG: YraN family protein [Hallerella sp.]|jgi:putative endonuclease|nr:YraN family protein [Hallerella sp.]